MGSDLKLSVYTIAYQSADQCANVIRDLQRQTIRSEIEVIVVAPDHAGLEDSELECFGAWQRITLPRVRTCGEAMLAAVRAAQAPFVTYAEEHSSFREDWAERVIAAHDQGYDVVGFAIENANPDTLTSWAHLYGLYGHMVTPVERAESKFLSGHHTSYKRDLLLGFNSLLSDLLEDESALFLDLRARRIRMFIAGDAVSGHLNISSLRTLIYMEYLGLRCFASTRAKIGNWQWWKRLAYALGMPLVPFVRMRRVVGNIQRTRRMDLLPRILFPMGLAFLAGAFGEMLGYLLGAGDCAERRVPMELDRSKYLSPKDQRLSPTSEEMAAADSR